VISALTKSRYLSIPLKRVDIPVHDSAHAHHIGEGTQAVANGHRSPRQGGLRNLGQLPLQHRKVDVSIRWQSQVDGDRGPVVAYRDRGNVRMRVPQRTKDRGSLVGLIAATGIEEERRLNMKLSLSENEAHIRAVRSIDAKTH
jgi:hypothetical protein